MLRPMIRVLFIALLLCPMTTAHAYDMTRKDRLNILYSNQVVFDRQGEPLVSVRITEGQESIRFKARGQAVLLPGGDDASQIKSPGRSDWTVRLERSKPGQVRWWVAVDRLPASELALVSARRKHWRDRGHQVKLFEAGALIGISGQTLDTRSITVAIEPNDDHGAAKVRATKLSEALGRALELVSEPVKRPTGWLVAKEARTKFEVRTRDLLWITQDETQTIEFPDLEWGHGTPRRGRMSRKYAGDLYVTVDRNGKLAVVNVLSAERLLEGVVPSELYPNAPLASLRAQAVAARGQLLAKVGTRHRSDPYLLCAETHCQVYSGTTRKHRRTNEAVRSTRGQLLFHGDHLVDTTYSSACGGHSEAFHLMWGGQPKPYSTGIFDREGGGQTPIKSDEVTDFIRNPPQSYCRKPGKKSSVFRWQVERSAGFVNKAVNQRKEIGQVTKINPLTRGRSGRALSVEYVGTKGTLVVEGSYNNRKLLGGLRSGMWVVTPSGTPPTKWSFEGGGFGHGVGLCQHGAIGMAREKKEHGDILKHYYPGSQLKTAW